MIQLSAEELTTIDALERILSSVHRGQIPVGSHARLRLFKYARGQEMVKQSLLAARFNNVEAAAPSPKAETMQSPPPGALVARPGPTPKDVPQVH